MVQSRGPLGLSIPNQVYPKEPGFDTHPKKVEDWIGTLPRAHVGETSRLVYNAIVEINRLEISPEQRFSILEQLHEPMSYVFLSLRRHYIGQYFPLTQKCAKVAALAHEIMQEYATGYKIVIEKLLSGRFIANDNRFLVRATYRAIEMLGLLSFNCYQTYSPHTVGLWSELHKLYEFSRHNNTNHHSLTDLPHMLPQPETVDELYKQQLLLALVNPYQLTQEDCESIYACLSFWANYAILSEPLDINSPAGIFAVNLESDAPPTYYAYGSTRPGHCLILDTAELANHGRQLLHNGEPEHITIAMGNEARRLSIITVKRMLLSWGALSKRGFKRRGTSSQTRVFIGLSLIHDIFVESRQTQTRNKKAVGEGEFDSTFTSQSVVNADGEGVYPDTWDFDANLQTELRHEKDGSFTRTPTRQALNRPAKTNAPTVAQTFNITNESAGGYCLLWKHKLSGNLKVGELICMHQSDNAVESYNICVVRWMKNIGEMMVMGVEILSATADPIIVSGVNEEGEPTESQTRGLLLPAIDALHRPASLVTSTQFRSGDVVSFESGNGQIRVKLKGLSQLTAAFKQFRFESVTQESVSAECEEKGFESIWTSI